MHFDLNDLRLFVWAADEGSLTKAAAKQHLSLAAASARIKALEAQTDLPLLYREARGVRLSPPGQAFLHHARLMLRQVDQMRGDLQEYGGGLRGHLRVFANTTAVTDFLPEILPEFLADNPKVNIDLQEKPNADIARGVQDGRADIGIVAGQVDTLGLQSLHFSTDRLVLATAKNHPLAQRQKVAFVDTLDEDAVGMHHGSTLQNFLSQVTERLGKPLKLRIQLSSFDAMCRMIGAGVGVGIVPESAARRNQDAMNLALVELSDPWSVRERYILTRDQAALPGYAQSLIALLCAHYAQANKGLATDASPLI
ncbi:LysR family transcriptional regulator [Limnohabitans sp. TS-CS-82]|uniref:LysR family transcriptional regulator n=1 Tax=Limnohabitans sp. TS-CS-82 TaxID=2094193 RepID=UPI000CF28517|nr:LysR family transcriptional regulator [Limnohabitans sp. TS-CS-82]PQA83251.1 LysR family transcriptional regulator [Limnohabitans sp. TS-CS-82]